MLTTADLRHKILDIYVLQFDHISENQQDYNWQKIAKTEKKPDSSSLLNKWMHRNGTLNTRNDHCK